MHLLSETALFKVILILLPTLIVTGCGTNTPVKKSSEPIKVDSRPASEKTQKVVTEDLRKKYNKIFSLYQREARKNPYLEGEMIFYFVITPNSKAINCSVIASEIDKPQLHKDMCLVIEDIEFRNNITSNYEEITFRIEFFSSSYL